MKLVNIDLLQSVDKSGMHKVYDSWPRVGAAQYESFAGTLECDDVEHIVFAGMGGSGSIGDVFAAVLSKSDIDVDVVKGYHLPEVSNGNTLVVATSVSGNTQETLAAAAEAVKARCRTVAFSSGGELQKFCERSGALHVQVDMEHSPRGSFASYLYAMLGTLKMMLPLEEREVASSLAKMKNLSKQISSVNLDGANPAMSLAEWITSMPLIYYPWGFQAAAIRFKNSLQENAKMHAAAENVIEACHNGIVPWSVKSDARPILIRGADDHQKTKERWSILKEFFEKNGIDYMELLSVDGGILEKMVCLIYLLDYATIYRAVLSGVDPTQIHPIDFVKARLGRWEE